MKVLNLAAVLKPTLSYSKQSLFILTSVSK